MSPNAGRAYFPRRFGLLSITATPAFLENSYFKLEQVSIIQNPPPVFWSSRRNTLWINVGDADDIRRG